MANLQNTIINGVLRINGKINSSDVISAPSFVGALTGNAATATKLATARTINGVSFDGSANITVADSTKLPLTGGTLSGDLNFSHAGGEHPASIGWNTGTIRQRIRIFDEGATDNNVFEFQQSRDSGSTYTTLMAITADNKVKATTFTGALSGNAATATKLATARTINGTSFDGSGNITTANWGTARNVGIVNSDGTGTAVTVSVNGSGNVNLKLPATIKASLTGNADTATKLQTARNIAVTGSVSGNANFDGSANINISVNRKGATVGQSGNTTTKPWYKFASCTLNDTYSDRNIVFNVYQGFSDASAKVGILIAHFRTNSNKIWESGELRWLIKTTQMPASDFILAHNTTAPCVVELWCKCPNTYAGYHFDVISEGDRSNRGDYWTLYNNFSAGSQDAITSGYTQITSVVDKQSIEINTRNTTDSWIPVFKSGELQYTERVFATSQAYTNYNIGQDRIPTLSFLTFWNGAYNSSNNSNLTYAHQGIIQCKPKTLYDNSSGTTGTVTLSETAANFNYLELYYCDNNNRQHRSVRIANPNNKIVTLDTAEAYDKDKNIYVRTTNYTISNKSITVRAYMYMNFWQFSGGEDCGVDVEKSNYIKIVKVLGYK